VVRKPGSSKLTSHADSGAPLTANAERPTVQKTGPSKKLPDSLVVFENKALVAQAESSRNTAKDSPYKTWAARAASRRNADLAPAVTIPEATARGYLVHRVEPEYPERARRQRIQGRVVLNVVVGKDGTVQGTRPISGDSQLTLAALDAVRQWRFKPLVRNGQAVKFDSRFTFSFALP
jgi:TonB family protein